jgi:3-methyladenine DNA glycosylase AlkD
MAKKPAKRPAKKPATPSAPEAKRPKAAAAPKTRMTLAEAMKALEKAGTAQARKTYARHGAREPMFGVSFATLKVLAKKAGPDHDLARALWDTGNFDARNLAFKVADPAKTTAADLDRWARETQSRMWGGYVSMLAAEGPHGLATAKRWLASSEEPLRTAGWALVGQLAARDPAIDDAWLAERLAEVERSIHAAPDARKYAMNGALIAIGGRSPALRKAALAAAKRVGVVDVDHGDTSCETPDAAAYVEKTWAHAKAKGFATPSAQEQGREPPRTRC